MITKPHGIKGMVKVRPSLSVELFQEVVGQDVMLVRGEGVVCETKLSRAASGPGGMLCAFDGVEDRNAAAELAGCGVGVAKSQAPELGEGEYYVRDLVGLVVYNEEGVEIGMISRVLSMPGNDVYVVGCEDGDFMVPAVREVVREVDVAGGRIVVREVGGLRDLRI